MNTPPSAAIAPINSLIPQPAQVQPASGQFILAANVSISPGSSSPELIRLAGCLASQIQSAAGLLLPLSIDPSGPSSPSIFLDLDEHAIPAGQEAYRLEIAPQSVRLSASQPAGLFYAIQSLLQLLPLAADTAGSWVLPAGIITDQPRYAWRGFMLDVARHFFSVADVKRLIDLLAAYKLNRLHLHLSDDQGWRLMINAWPELALTGGRTAIGNDPGGYYTQADYSELVEYAAQRFITVVPEIDLPGHTHAALVAYPFLSCDGQPRQPYFGGEVGFSSLCVSQESTYAFLEDVIREIAAITPGPYIHIGGDEAEATQPDDYRRFIERVQDIVAAAGKRMVGWEETAQARLSPSSIPQVWNGKHIQAVLGQPGKSILSPANKTYLDMKYTPETSLGLKWAGYIEVRDAYDWDPAGMVAGLDDQAILGIEAPLWSETLRTLQDIEQMAFPRLLALAEVAWSPQSARAWDHFSTRLAYHGPRLAARGVNFYRSPQVNWI